MSQLDRDGLEAALNGLVRSGVLTHWEKRPLGMFFLVLFDGTILRPDTKETAMWVMGASTVAAHALGQGELRAAFATALPLQERLDACHRRGIIESWNQAGPVVTVTTADGETTRHSIAGAQLWAVVATAAGKPPTSDELQSARSHAERFHNFVDGRTEVIDLLRFLRDRGVVLSAHQEGALASVNLLDMATWTGPVGQLVPIVAGAIAWYTAAQLE